MFQQGDLVIVQSKTSVYNGKLFSVLGYTKGEYKDILLVSPIKVNIENDKFKLLIEYKKKWQYTEDSLKEATIYDIIRNLEDKDLEIFLTKPLKTSLIEFLTNSKELIEMKEK